MHFRGAWIGSHAGTDLAALALLNSRALPALDPPRRWKILQRFFARCASGATPRKLLCCCSRAAAPHCEPPDRTWAGTWTGGLGPPTATSRQRVRKDENDCGSHTLQARCFHVSAPKSASLQPCGRLLLGETCCCCPLEQEQLRLIAWLTTRWLAERI